MNKIPQTLGYYLKNSYNDLIGKEFQKEDYVYTIQEIWRDTKTKDICCKALECDLGDMGRVTSVELNLSKAKYMHDLEELIKDVNAEMVNCFTYYNSSI